MPIGIDGLTLIEAKDGPAMNLTQADIYKALAANPFGKGPNTAQTWKDVNPALPAIKIRVLGPPPTSGTRDSLADLYLDQGLRHRSGDEGAEEDATRTKHKEICTKIREDGAYVEAGENDNLLVQKVAGDPGTLGVLGYHFLEENADKVEPVADRRRRADRSDDRDLTYPGARKLYIYVKGEHMAAKPAIKRFRRGLCQGVGQGRPARAARPGAVRRRRRERCGGAGDARSSRSTRRLK